MSHRASACAVVVAALVVTGCGGGGTPVDTGPSARELAATLVAADDLGTGWSVLTPPEDYGSVGVVTEKNRGMVPQLQFCDKAGSASQKAAKVLSWEAFTQHNYDTGNQRHLVFVQEFLRSDRATKVRSAFDLLASGMRACEGERSDYPDGEVGTQSGLDLPALGQDRVGARELVTEPGDRPATWDIRTALVRRGEVLLGITFVEITSPGQDKVFDDTEVADLMAAVAEGAF